ncbi:metallophosphoesterase [Pricia sp. S334]|uniref:Metallophosphoesterase n=1 Tax=Pricia mediterranea TaxID=3076079 RepID=A0ABU3L982_9FLAO|nr:metallophosphoesterase [Pricia sp. S334]MDT7830294.1 metallophosphoesterase [Pricia sp. S334]
MGRRNFLMKLFLGIAGLLFLDSFWFERYIIDWKEFDISEGSADKIKLIQLSDLHINSVKAFHRSLAERINSERPDALLVTGDSLNNKHGIAPLDDFLAMIDHDIPKFAIMGNVDYSGRVDLTILKNTYEKHNGTFLINQNHPLQVGERTVNLVGVDDYLYGNPDFSKASRGVDSSLDTIVLNHCPVYRNEIDAINRKLDQKVKLVLSGHTHGGQITFFGKVIITPNGSGDYVKGWYENETSRMYVSKGIGTRGIPFRFGSRAEAVIFYV